MKQLSRKDIENIYYKSRNKALKAYSRKDFETALLYAKLCAKVAYGVSFIFSDKVLDDMIYQISCSVLTGEISGEKNGRVVFYDYYPHDNRGLSQQYLMALVENSVEFLYIIENWIPEKTEDIIKIVTGYERGDLLVLDSDLTEVEKAQIVNSKILEFSPDKALLHLLPWDVAGCMVFSRIQSITRYMIDLTDHAYWLGVNCFDYLIEFRSFGHVIANEKRGVGDNKIMKLPYYPVLSERKFEGFSFNKEEDKIYFLTGGAYYKTYGDNYLFYELLRNMLLKHSNLVILFAGSGNSSFIDNFIKENKFEQRLILLGDRKDIAQVFRNIDVFLATYPVGGGLMTQLAAMTDKPILAFVNNKNRSNFPESLMYHLPKDVKLSFDNMDDFYQEVNLLVSSEEYRSKRAAMTANRIISFDEFNSLFNECILKNTIKNENKESFFIDYDYRVNMYLKIENDYFHFIPKSIIKTLKLRALVFAPILSVGYLLQNISFILRRLKK